jgi:hypothetical protein
VKRLWDPSAHRHLRDAQGGGTDLRRLCLAAGDLDACFARYCVHGVRTASLTGVLHKLSLCRYRKQGIFAATNGGAEYLDGLMIDRRISRDRPSRI